MKEQIIYFYTDESFNYGDCETFYEFCPAGFEIDIDFLNETADFNTLQGLGVLGADVEKCKTPQEFIKWLENSVELINKGDREGTTDPEIINEIIYFIQNQKIKKLTA